MPVATLLPFNATPNRKSASPTSFRLTEKFILLLVFSAFITLCFGAIFFLPDSSKLLSGVFFHSSAVETNTRTGPDNSDPGSAGNDERVLAKIRKDHEKALLEAKDTLQKRPDEIKQDIKNDKEKVAKEGDGLGAKDGNNLPFVEYHRPPGATGHEPLDPETRDRRAKVKEVCSTLPNPVRNLQFLIPHPRTHLPVRAGTWPNMWHESSITTLEFGSHINHVWSLFCTKFKLLQNVHALSPKSPPQISLYAQWSHPKSSDGEFTKSEHILTWSFAAEFHKTSSYVFLEILNYDVTSPCACGWTWLHKSTAFQREFCVTLLFPSKWSSSVFLGPAWVLRPPLPPDIPVCPLYMSGSAQIDTDLTHISRRSSIYDDIYRAPLF